MYTNQIIGIDTTIIREHFGELSALLFDLKVRLFSAKRMDASMSKRPFGVFGDIFLESIEEALDAAGDALEDFEDTGDEEYLKDFVDSLTVLPSAMLALRHLSDEKTGSTHMIDGYVSYFHELMVALQEEFLHFGIRSQSLYEAQTALDQGVKEIY